MLSWTCRHVTKGGVNKAGLCRLTRDRQCCNCHGRANFALKRPPPVQLFTSKFNKEQSTSNGHKMAFCCCFFFISRHISGRFVVNRVMFDATGPFWKVLCMTGPTVEHDLRVKLGENMIKNALQCLDTHMCNHHEHYTLSRPCYREQAEQKYTLSGTNGCC